MKRKSMLWALLMTCAVGGSPLMAQILPPNLGPSEIPSKPLTLIFKDITRHELFGMVVDALKQSQKVKPLVMRRASRGWIEYEGLYSGTRTELMDLLAPAVFGKLTFKTENKGEEGLEIIVTP